ncbi:hypothetical protein JOD45_002749 [Scopulibacillus daqui]|uniref:Uncharacterized protein n=1 Tax=Scopulibacillus daqui TaxID=1469162 RepID=A0ABS2Q4A1_9BACL|nr:hypothetical protein [Scopulibacillus daqui]MBM7646519.1 hypothetical protein [Scopulibacillus daqui]
MFWRRKNDQKLLELERKIEAIRSLLLEKKHEVNHHVVLDNRHPPQPGQQTNKSPELERTLDSIRRLEFEKKKELERTLDAIKKLQLDKRQESERTLDAIRKMESDKRTELDKKLEKVEDLLTKLGKKAFTYEVTVENLHVHDPKLDNLTFSFDALDVKEVSGALNLGNNFGVKVDQTGKKKKDLPPGGSDRQNGSPSVKFKKKEDSPQNKKDQKDQSVKKQKNIERQSSPTDLKDPKTPVKQTQSQETAKINLIPDHQANQNDMNHLKEHRPPKQPPVRKFEEFTIHYIEDKEEKTNKAAKASKHPQPTMKKEEAETSAIRNLEASKKIPEEETARGRKMPPPIRPSGKTENPSMNQGVKESRGISEKEGARGRKTPPPIRPSGKTENLRMNQGVKESRGIPEKEGARGRKTSPPIRPSGKTENPSMNQGVKESRGIPEKEGARGRKTPPPIRPSGKTENPSMNQGVKESRGIPEKETAKIRKKAPPPLRPSVKAEKMSNNDDVKALNGVPRQEAAKSQTNAPQGKQSENPQKRHVNQQLKDVNQPLIKKSNGVQVPNNRTNKQTENNMPTNPFDKIKVLSPSIVDQKLKELRNQQLANKKPPLWKPSLPLQENLSQRPDLTINNHNFLKNAKRGLENTKKLNQLQQFQQPVHVKHKKGSFPYRPDLPKDKK